MATHVLWKNYKLFTSSVKPYIGKDTYKIFGEYKNEFGKLTKCHVFTGEYYDNWPNWEPLLNEMKNNRGRYYLVSGMRFKNRNQNLFSADSQPRVLDSIDKKEWNKPEKVVEPVKPVKEFENDLFTVE